MGLCRNRSSEPTELNPQELCGAHNGAADVGDMTVPCEGPIGVGLCYRPENLPSQSELDTLMAGFDGYMVVAADNPSNEMNAEGIGDRMNYQYADGTSEFADQTWGLGETARTAATAGGARLSFGGHPYLYRYLHASDSITLGLNPNTYLSGGNTPLISPGGVAAETAAMTGRAISTQGADFGTNRIATLQTARDALRFNRSDLGTQPLVRLNAGQLDWIDARDIRSQMITRIGHLDSMLAQLAADGRGNAFAGDTRDLLRSERNYLNNALSEGRFPARGEAHIVGTPRPGNPVVAPHLITPLIANPASGPTILESPRIGISAYNDFMRLRSVRVTGGVLMVVGATASLHRIYSANPGERGRIIAQEAGAFGGGMVGAWGGAQAGAAIGAMIGTAIAPGLGTVIGGVVGGLIGMFAGGALGGGGLGATGADYIYVRAVDEATSQAALGYGIGQGPFSLTHRYA